MDEGRVGSLSIPTELLASSPVAIKAKVLAVGACEGHLPPPPRGSLRMHERAPRGCQPDSFLLWSPFWGCSLSPQGRFHPVLCWKSLESSFGHSNDSINEQMTVFQTNMCSVLVRGPSGGGKVGFMSLFLPFTMKIPNRTMQGHLCELL